MDGIGQGHIRPFLDISPNKFTVTRYIDGGRVGIQWALLRDHSDTPALNARLDQYDVKILWQESWTDKELIGIPYFDSLEDCIKAIDEVINPYELAMRIV